MFRTPGKMKYIELIVLLFLFCTCAAKSVRKFTFQRRQPDVRIIGGQEAHPLQFPYAAGIYVHTADSRYFCGGTLLSSRWILTAGQCVSGATLFEIYLGSINLNGNDSNSLKLSTSTFVLHPEYDPLTLQNDIGLIELRIPITFNDYLKPVDRLPLSEISDGVRVAIFGWGQLSDQDVGLADDLHWVAIVTISNTECKITYGNQITDKMVCANGNYNEGTCQGDIGGSLVQYYSTGHAIPVGIASFVSSNGCESTDPSGFTRVYPYNTWIRNVTGLDL